MASSRLQLFPSVEQRPVPRKSSLRQPKAIAVPETQAQLQCLALKVTASPEASPRLQPAANTFKHSLFCEPPTSPDIERVSVGTPRRQNAKRRWSRPDSLLALSPPHIAQEVTSGEDELSPLPVSTTFGQTTSPVRHPSKRLRRSPAPAPLPFAQNPQIPASLNQDRLSPLPVKTCFSPPTPKSPEHPTPLSQRSAVSLPRRSDSMRKVPPWSPATPTMKSIFPQYDPFKPMDEQSYFPTGRACAQAIPKDKISKFGSTVDRSLFGSTDSRVALNGYEHISLADDDDVLTIWNAADGRHTAAERKVQLGVFQPEGTSLVVGTTPGQPLFLMVKDYLATAEDNVRDFAVEKFDYHRGGFPVSVSRLSMPEQKSADSKTDEQTMAIFPKEAAVKAKEAVANSPAVEQLAHSLDPHAISPDAAELAREAASVARSRHACQLTRKTRKRDSPGAVTAEYSLVHPTLGTLPVTVSKSFRAAAPREPRAKISIHHPTATPAAVVAETLVLAFIDFARDACVLDLPGLRALDSPHIIDTAMSTLFAVAATENSLLHTESITFAPPPKSFYADRAGLKALAKEKKNDRLAKRTSRAIDRAQEGLVGQPADVSKPVEGAVKLVGFGLKAAVYAIEAGIKVGLKVVNRVVAPPKTHQRRM